MSPCLIAQKSNTLNHLGAIKTYCSTTFHPSSSRRDSQWGCLLDRLRNRNSRRHFEAYAFVAQLEVLRIDRQESPGNGSQCALRIVLSPSSPVTEFCYVFFPNANTMSKSHFSENKDSLISILETNWKYISSASFWRQCDPAWQERRQWDTRRGDQSYGNQEKRTALSPLFCMRDIKITCQLLSHRRLSWRRWR